MTSPWSNCPPTGPWADTSGDYQIVQLTFDRYSAGFDVQYRDTSLALVSSNNIIGELEPADFQQLLIRSEFGQIHEIGYFFYVEGNADIRVSDRTVISAQPLEVAHVKHYGTMNTEAHLRWLR